MIKYYDVSSFQGTMQLPSDTAAIVAKATEGNYYRDSSYAWFKQQATDRGLPFSGYHFLKQEIDPAVQAQYYHDFAGNVPCMLDVETEGSSHATVDQVVAFTLALQRLGGRVWGAYIPRWYWSQIGGDLSRLTALGAVLISSNYTSYSDTGPGWQPYGGATPVVWQYTSTPLDTNAFKGTPAELAALINGDNMDPSTPLTFDPRITGWYPDIAKDGGVWAGTQSLNDVLTWMAARVGHLVHVTENLQKSVNALQGGAGASPQAVAAETLAELKAKL